MLCKESENEADTGTLTVNQQGDTRGMSDASQAALVPGGEDKARHGLRTKEAQGVSAAIHAALEAVGEGHGLTLLTEAGLAEGLTRGTAILRRAYDHMDGLSSEEITSTGNLAALAELRRWEALHLSILIALSNVGLSAAGLGLQERITKARERLADKGGGTENAV